MSSETYFAPAEKATKDELTIEIDLVSNNAVVSGLLHSVSGVLAIVNSQRQVVAFNDTFMRMLNVANPQEVLGLRPGEILQCEYAKDDPSGCGTTRHCATCGAAVAMVTSLGEQKPAERICALKAQRGETELDLVFSVRSQPLTINDKRFVLLFLQDITRQQQAAAFERTFFHDVANLLSMLVGSSELLVEEHPSPLATSVHKAAMRLQDEIAIQRFLARGKGETYTPFWFETTVTHILNELQQLFANHPASRNKIIEFDYSHADIAFTTDISLILRILCNMIINALEASSRDDRVKVWCSNDDKYICFNVWNRAHIEEALQHRIFQRNFSSKEQTGRGIGTYSMKLLGEKLLGGEVGFTSLESVGTTFVFRLPR